MPPIKKISKEAIIKAAYNIARKKGIEGINAREIAKKLNCSVQPIFHNFANMEEVKQEVIEKILETYRNYIEPKQTNEPSYKQIGLGYIKFAKEEPKLFHEIFMNETKLNSEGYITSDKSFEVIEDSIIKATNFSNEEAKKFHIKMWIFTHGLATLIATKTCRFTDEEISNLLTEQYTALIKLEKGN